MTVDLIKEAMLTQQDAKGFILVGFPKNPRMSSMFNRQVKWPEKVVALEVDNEVSLYQIIIIIISRRTSTGVRSGLDPP